jgi:hypothetical protein
MLALIEVLKLFIIFLEPSWEVTYCALVHINSSNAFHG